MAEQDTKGKTSIWQMMIGAGVVAAVITVLGGLVQQVFIVGPQQKSLQTLAQP